MKKESEREREEASERGRDRRREWEREKERERERDRKGEMNKKREREIKKTVNSKKQLTFQIRIDTFENIMSYYKCRTVFQKWRKSSKYKGKTTDSLFTYAQGINFTNIVWAVFCKTLLFAQLFCTVWMGLYSFGKRKLTQKLLEKCWWNRLKVDDLSRGNGI